MFVSASQAELSIEGRIEPRSKRGYVAVVSVDDRSGRPLGSRKLATSRADCRALDQTVALAIALMVDPDAALSRKPARQAAAPPPVSAPRPRVIEKRVPVYVPVPIERPPPALRPNWRGDVFAAVSAGAGYLPNPSLAAVGGASLEPPHFVSLEAVVTVFLPQQEPAPRGATVSFFLAKMGLFVCPLSRRGQTLAGRVCGGTEGGIMIATGHGFDADHAGVRPQFAVAARARLSVKILGPLALAGALSGSIPLEREQFVYHEASGTQVKLFRVPAVEAQGEIGLEWRFP